MAAILFVRVKSGVEPEELMRRVVERRPRFTEVPGLVQKFYGRDPSTGDWCGVYLFENSAALKAFRESELAKTIASAYEATEVRPEVYDLLFSLYPDRGPIDA